MSGPSTKPYLVRAIYEWCNDCGYTPHLAVLVGGAVRVPKEFVQDGQIVLNISLLATSRLQIENDAVRFQARFSGKAREIYVPIEYIRAIFARENGEGMAFDVPDLSAMPDLDAADSDAAESAAADTESARTPIAPAAPPVPSPTLSAVPTPPRSPARAAKGGGGAKVKPFPARDAGDLQDEPPPEPPAGPSSPNDRPRLTRVK